MALVVKVSAAWKFSESRIGLVLKRQAMQIVFEVGNLEFQAQEVAGFQTRDNSGGCYCRPILEGQDVVALTSGQKMIKASFTCL
jgi:hypothetical protein